MLNFPGLLDNTLLPPRDVMSVCVFCRIFNRTLLTMAICVQALDSAVLYAFLRLQGEAMALKHDKKASMKCLYLGLMGFGKL